MLRAGLAQVQIPAFDAGQEVAAILWTSLRGIHSASSGLLNLRESNFQFLGNSSNFSIATLTLGQFWESAHHAHEFGFVPRDVALSESGCLGLILGVLPTTLKSGESQLKGGRNGADCLKMAARTAQ